MVKLSCIPPELVNPIAVFIRKVALTQLEKVAIVGFRFTRDGSSEPLGMTQELSNTFTILDVLPIMANSTTVTAIDGVSVDDTIHYKTGNLSRSLKTTLESMGVKTNITKDVPITIKGKLELAFKLVKGDVSQNEIALELENGFYVLPAVAVQKISFDMSEADKGNLSYSLDSDEMEKQLNSLLNDLTKKLII